MGGLDGTLPAYDLRDLKVLIVDNNKYMRQLIRHIFHVFSVRQVRESDDAQEAYKEFQTFRPDIVTCEWDLAPMTGAEFVKMLRQAEDSHNPMVSIIMITAYGEAGVVQAARDSGINEFLAKPISPKRLYQRLVKIIDRPRPFIRCKSYVGPCRHRHKDDIYDGPRRRNADGVEIVEIGDE